jgi:hypothetical protein
MWRRVDLVWTDVSEEGIASIFRVEKSAIEEAAWASGCRLSHQCFRLLVQSAATCSRWFLTRGFFYPEDEGDISLRNVGSHKIYTAPHSRRLHSPCKYVIKRFHILLSRINFLNIHLILSFVYLFGAFLLKILNFWKYFEEGEDA